MLKLMNYLYTGISLYLVRSWSPLRFWHYEELNK